MKFLESRIKKLEAISFLIEMFQTTVSRVMEKYHDEFVSIYRHLTFYRSSKLSFDTPKVYELL